MSSSHTPHPPRRGQEMGFGARAAQRLKEILRRGSDVPRPLPSFPAPPSFTEPKSRVLFRRRKEEDEDESDE